MSVLEPIRSRGSGAAGIVHGNEWSWFNHARYDTGGTNQTGRLASIGYKAAAADTILEKYSYTAAGLVSGKDFAVTRLSGRGEDLCQRADLRLLRWPRVPVCPVSAIFALDDLPEKWNEFTKRNADYYGR